MAIAAKDRNHGRQWPLVVVQDFDYTEVEDTVAVPAVKLPAGARVIGGGVLVTTAFDFGTTNAVDVGDGGDADRYSGTPVDLSATGWTALDVTGYGYPISDYIDLTADVTGTAATQGEAKLIVEYIVDGRANEVNPDYD